MALVALLAHGLPAEAVDVADAVVIDNITLVDDVGGNDLLRHNVPNLELRIDGEIQRADFASHFLNTGGIKRWGLATSEVLAEESNAITQYYQRGVVDYHLRGDLGGIWVIERRLAWDYVGGGRGGSRDMGTEPTVINSNPGRQIGPWGHRVSNLDLTGRSVGFADFFNELGGIASFGLPKTDARIDTGSPGTLLGAGWTPGFVRQYFQAAVFEFHPGDSANPVKLALLGDTLRNLNYPQDYWYSLVPFRGAAPLVENAIYEILEVVPLAQPPTAANTLPRGELYAFGSRTAGLLVWDGQGWRTVEVSNSPLASDTIRSVFVTADRGIWLGTDGGAFLFPYFDPAGNVVLNAASDGLAANIVRQVTGITGRILLLALEQGGVAQYVPPSFGATRGSLAQLPVGAQGLPSYNVRQLALTTEFPPRIWAATGSGLAYFDGANWATLSTSHGLPSRDLTAVVASPSGEIWVGTDDAGVAVSLTGASGTFVAYGLDDGLPSLAVRDILLATNGAVWVATDGGVAVIEAGQFDFRAYRSADGQLPSDDVRQLAEDSSGRILMATGDGAALYDPINDSWKVWSRANGLADNDLLSVAVIPSVG